MNRFELIRGEVKHNGMPGDIAEEMTNDAVEDYGVDIVEEEDLK